MLSTSIDNELADYADVLRSPAWMSDAACTETGDVGFFPDKGQPTAAARAVCAGCLVRAACLAYALEHEIDDGVWGATSPTERRELRARRPLNPRAAPEPPASFVCEECAVAFTPKYRRPKNRLPRYCSNRCSARHQVRHSG